MRSNQEASVRPLPECLFRALADRTRLRALVLLAREGELCVCELTHALLEIQPKISRHLGQLRELGLVTDRRAGQWVYYRLHPALPEWAAALVAGTAAAVADQPPYREDWQRLQSMSGRPEGRCCVPALSVLEGESPMTDTVYNVLFLCTGNSARSIMAESLINRWGEGRFRGFSAGSHPRGEVHPIAMTLLRRFNMPVAGLRSKSWDELCGPEAPPLDFVFTVCDKVAGELCPAWPGQPMTAHWGVEDPAAAEGPETERMLVFRRVFRELENRIKIFTSLRLEALDRLRLQEQLEAIGRTRLMQPATAD
jgi:arsenate reductase